MAIARRVNRVGIVRLAKIVVATGLRAIAKPSLRRAAASVNRMRTKATTAAARNRAGVVAVIAVAVTVAVANSVAEAVIAGPTCAAPKAPSKSNTTS